MKKTITSLALFTGLFTAADLITKYLAVIYLATPYTETIYTITSFARLAYTENTGIAFSISIPFALIIILNIALLAFLTYFAFKELKITKPATQIFIALILGGGLGNLLDRLYNGFVVDFISIGAYPSFNLADVFITIGVFSTLLFYGKISRTNKRK